MKRGRCIRCGKDAAATPELNVYTRKGLIHVACVLVASEKKS